MQLRTALRSRVMRVMASERLLKLQRWRASLGNATPVVHYFHQVDDPYSHLAVQQLPALLERYRVAFAPHLVSPPAADYQGDAERFETWARRDAATIAEGYGLAFPNTRDALSAPAQEQVIAAQNDLVPLLPNDPEGYSDDSGLLAFAHKATANGNALWAREQIHSDATAPSLQLDQALTTALAEGDTLRQKLGHYQGAMFWFCGEWFWGVDRLHLLEAQLIAKGHSTNPAAGLVCPPPVAQPLPEDADASQVTLEYFPSLRSPYTAIGHQRVVDMIQRSGVSVVVRPVMPMLMRGIPAPTSKQRYIISDAAREARYLNEPFGNFVDPFGEPVKRAFALFPAAEKENKGMEFIGAYLRAAFAEGTDITSKSGLAKVARDAGLELSALQTTAAQHNWEQILEDNVQQMLGAGLWGVPSFRVSGGNQTTPFACWGQDRIWRVETEITRRAG